MSCGVMQKHDGKSRARIQSDIKKRKERKNVGRNCDFKGEPARLLKATTFVYP